MRFSELLKNKKLTQTELARKAKLSISIISRYVKKERNPSLQTMQKLADALDVDLQTIVACFVQDNKKTKKE